MGVWITVIVVALVLSIGDRVWRYRSIRAEGHEVRWSIPVVRWARHRSR